MQDWEHFCRELQSLGGLIQAEHRQKAQDPGSAGEHWSHLPHCQMEALPHLVDEAHHSLDNTGFHIISFHLIL